MFRSNTLRKFIGNLYIHKTCNISKVSNISKVNSRLQYQKRQFKMSSILKSNKIYTDSEEWLHETYEATRMGLTNNAINEMSDLVYIEFLYEKGNVVKKDEEIVAIESVKATNSILAPYDLVLLENNTDIEDTLEIINNEPENVDTSWIIKIDKIP